MATATTISLPYNTPLSTIKNTAVASWSGFVYQGLCALHHTLMLLKSDWDLAISKYLSLEAYEDFAILDSTCKIESLHQCKCYSSPSDFTDECKKMADKEFYWKNVKRALSDAYKGMFFHSNQDNTLGCGVKAYTFFSGKTKIGPFDIYALVEVVVQDILKCRRIAGSSNVKTCKLISEISKHVSYIHKECIKNQGHSFSIAVGLPIPIKVLADILEDPQEQYTKEERIETCRFYMIMALKNRAMTKPGVDIAKMDKFVSKVESLTQTEMQNFARRIFPDMDITASNFNIGEIINMSRTNYLFNVIDKVAIPLNLESLDWKDSVGFRQSPSTIGKDKDPEEYCSDIINNPYASDLRRDYRWIVGDIEHSVDDIEEGAKLITGVLPTDYTDVTQANKIGLKDINTKNNEDNA